MEGRKKVGYGASAGTLYFSMGVSREWSGGVMLVPLSAIVFHCQGRGGKNSPFLVPMEMDVPFCSGQKVVEGAVGWFWLQSRCLKLSEYFTCNHSL